MENTLRERVVEALEQAFDKHRRNQVFRIYVIDRRLMPVTPASDIREIYVLTQDDHLPFNCNPNAYHGACIYKRHYKAAGERYLDAIMATLVQNINRHSS